MSATTVDVKNISAKTEDKEIKDFFQFWQASFPQLTLSHAHVHQAPNANFFPLPVARSRA